MSVLFSILDISRNIECQKSQNQICDVTSVLLSSRPSAALPRNSPIQTSPCVSVNAPSPSNLEQLI
ncbi:hypothetical protein EYF80_060295 [Liparis tanakae]|uniref:Uncharacterized protein n=1 Tax=Liparis tanakae TaxID=230148 RepID=A0A4Z2ELB8_9TELE|nr:hypothetical protein EYF80_060295 [Liparis tanakae]